MDYIYLYSAASVVTTQVDAVTWQQSENLWVPWRGNAIYNEGYAEA